ncbi:hypothetical protein BH10ACI3_BH10ACI3_12800 [soil metagenome]
MKYCPLCQERFDEEIIRFCTKDGTPLVEEGQPSFTAIPSENVDEADDFGEETIIRRKPVGSEPFGTTDQGERIVIPTTPAGEQQVRPRTIPAYYAPPQPPNTVKTVVLTIVGTLVVLGFGAALFWLFQKEPPPNANTNVNVNLNANQNMNLNTNLGFDSNFNFNTNANYAANYNLNSNFNANIKTPSPTPSPKPSPSASPSASPTASPSPSASPKPPVNRPPANASPAPAGTPRTGPRPPTMTSNKPGNSN